ncbi:hypothetical protein GJ744_003028 [Endocarpon pusillum]|uniref:Uncharacterized protein n=1 Tax=Endocarpon pusillum TaxID=364733 RepID=A0A8H7A863_9EURO|nr:hypothetical protein GJ744_003028 [Endocarpon pusillum]
MATLSFDRSSHLRFSAATASGSSDWHAANAPKMSSTKQSQGWIVTPLNAPTAMDKRSNSKAATVTIAPVEVSRPQRCRVRRGNGDADGLTNSRAEAGVREVEVVQRMGRMARRADRFQR